MIVRFVDLIVYMHMSEDGRRSIGDVQRVMGVDAAGDYILNSS
jgi:Flp pilus assembly CpaF family ATPase